VGRVNSEWQRQREAIALPSSALGVSAYLNSRRGVEDSQEQAVLGAFSICSLGWPWSGGGSHTQRGRRGRGAVAGGVGAAPAQTGSASRRLLEYFLFRFHFFPGAHTTSHPPKLGYKSAIASSIPTRPSPTVGCRTKRSHSFFAPPALAPKTSQLIAMAGPKQVLHLRSEQKLYEHRSCLTQVPWHFRSGDTQLTSL
jgi:hypothetical protein